MKIGIKKKIITKKKIFLVWNKFIKLIFFLKKKANIPKVKIKKLINKSILRKKWRKVIINEIIIEPKKKSKKKFFFIFKSNILPKPDTDKDIKIILTKKISIWDKIINLYFKELLKSSIVLSNAFEKFILALHPYWAASEISSFFLFTPSNLILLSNLIKTFESIFFFTLSA